MFQLKFKLLLHLEIIKFDNNTDVVDGHENSMLPDVNSTEDKLEPDPVVEVQLAGMYIYIRFLFMRKLLWNYFSDDLPAVVDATDSGKVEENIKVEDTVPEETEKLPQSPTPTVTITETVTVVNSVDSEENQKGFIL